MMTETPTETPAYRPLPALRKWLDDREVRQHELAKMLGVTEAQVSRWLSGKRSVPAASAIKLSQITGIPAARLSNRAATTRLLKHLVKRPMSRAKTLRNHDDVA